MTYVRVTRDQRGYENTFLLHTPRPGERPRVLYWYRTAPGVRVGRRALDEDAIRRIEEEHPEIDFDWPLLIEEASAEPSEVERRPERRRRPPRPRDPEVEVEASAQAAAEPGVSPAALPRPADDADEPQRPAATAGPAAARDAAPNPLLEQLVGREIAQRLRARYAEISTRVLESTLHDPTRLGLRARADALDPDRWLTVDAVLQGVEHADRLLDDLRRDL